MLTLVLVLALLLTHLLVHRDEGGWMAKADPGITVAVDGHLVEYEWFHVAQTVGIVEGGTVPNPLASQTMYRFVGAYLIALLREPLGSLYNASVAAHMIWWVLACGAIFSLAVKAAKDPLVGMAGAVLVATGPGFIFYLGNVDVHPSAYAAVALWLLAVEKLAAFRAESLNAERLAGAVFCGLTLAAVGYTLEAGLPLLGFAWLYYLPLAISTSPRRTASTVTQLLLFTVSFAGAYLGYRVLVEHILLPGKLHALNDPFSMLRTSLLEVQAVGAVPWVGTRLAIVAGNISSAFPLPVLLMASVGVMGLQRRWTLWCLLFVATFIGAITLTKPAVREVFFTYAAIYLLAASGCVWLSTIAARCVAPWAGPRGHEWVRTTLVCACLAVAIVVTNADLLGDYYLPARWWNA